eukprot:TRINITY_DN3356_c0_g1_i5.p1 TRINITY_DN3356_c0_g1~~TRINITY_DN3356_c0_g1_i5.p1  ORF type:complete len:292 (-),score=45.49 TRINITY_DN3356_c0_g1_i5:348-1223(-)
MTETPRAPNKTVADLMRGFGFVYRPYPMSPVFAQLQHVYKLASSVPERDMEAEYESINASQLEYVSRHPEALETSPTVHAKNRYTNILPLKASIVRLRGSGGNPASQYIHANYVSDQLILTQGPLRNTTEDVWRMILEQNIHTVVMLTKLSERGREKCHMYWNEQEPLAWLGLQVRMLQKTSFADSKIILRFFEVSDGTTKRVIKHLQYEGWPDHGVPTSGNQILRLVSLATEYVPNVERLQDTYFAAHCSAGIGRAGCFSVIFRALTEASNFARQVFVVENLSLNHSHRR